MIDCPLETILDEPLRVTREDHVPRGPSEGPWCPSGARETVLLTYTMPLMRRPHIAFHPLSGDSA